MRIQGIEISPIKKTYGEKFTGVVKGKLFLEDLENSTGFWTPPGYASMLTRLYVSEHGIYVIGYHGLHHTILMDRLKSYLFIQ